MPIRIDKISSLPDVTDIDNTYVPTFNKATGKNEKVSIPALRDNAAQKQSDWNQGDASQADFIKNKPEIPDAQKQSDWNQGDASQADFIKNKPEIPAITDPQVEIVTDMFTAMQTGKVFLVHLNKDVSTGNKTIEIFAELDPAADEPLQLVPEFGFGPAKTWPQPVPGYDVVRDADGAPVLDANGNTTPAEEATNFKVYVQAEFAAVDADGNPVLDDNGDPLPAAQGLVVFPTGSPGGTVKYLVGSGSSAGLSYFVDTNGLYKRFHSETTPLANFGLAGEQYFLVINGESVYKGNIAEQSFGFDYAGATVLPGGFLNGFSGLRKLNASVLGSVTQTGGAFLNGLAMPGVLDILWLNKLTVIKRYSLSWLSQIMEVKHDFSQVTTVEPEVLMECPKMTYIDLSTWGNVAFIDHSFLKNNAALTGIKLGSVDWSGKTVSAANRLLNVPNVATSTLYADTQAVADAFKAKVPEVSEWGVVVSAAGMFLGAQWMDVVPPFSNGDVVTLEMEINPELFTIPQDNLEAYEMLAPAFSGEATLLWTILTSATSVMMNIQLSGNALGSSFSITLLGTDDVLYSYTVNIDAQGYPDKPAY